MKTLFRSLGVILACIMFCTQEGIANPALKSVASLNREADSLIYIDRQASERIAREALNLARETQDKKGMVFSYNVLGVCAKVNGNYPLAIAYYDSCMSLAKMIGHHRFVAKVKNNKANIFLEQNNRSEAVRLFREASVYFVTDTNDFIKAIVARNLANAYSKVLYYDEAKVIFFQSLKFFQHSFVPGKWKFASQRKNQEQIGAVLTEMAALYGKQGKLDTARALIDSARIVLEEIPELFGAPSSTLPRAYITSADIHLAAGEFADARSICEKVLSLPDSITFEKDLADTYMNLGELDIVRGDFQGAINNFHKARTIAVDMVDPKRQGRAWHWIGRAYLSEQMANNREVIFSCFQKAGSFLGKISEDDYITPANYLISSILTPDQIRYRVEYENWANEASGAEAHREVRKMDYERNVAELNATIEELDTTIEELEASKKTILGLSSVSILLGLLFITGIGFYNRNRIKQKALSAKYDQETLIMLIGQQKEFYQVLHNEFKPELSVVKMGLSSIVEKDRSKLPKADQIRIAEAENVVSDVFKKMHAYSQEASSKVEDLDVCMHISHFCNVFRKSGDLEVHFYHVGMDENMLSNEIKLSLCRFVKELLTNAQNHSQGDTLVVNLSHEDGKVGLVVSDNGIGIDESLIRRGSGLDMMKRRVARLGGTTEIRTLEDGGTIISINLS